MKVYRWLLSKFKKSAPPCLRLPTPKDDGRVHFPDWKVDRLDPIYPHQREYLPEPYKFWAQLLSPNGHIGVVMIAGAEPDDESLVEITPGQRELLDGREVELAAWASENLKRRLRFAYSLLRQGGMQWR